MKDRCHDPDVLSFIDSATNAPRILANGAIADVTPAKAASVGSSGPAPAANIGAAGPHIPAYAQRWVSAYDAATRVILSLHAAQKLYGADSFLIRTARGMADQVDIVQSTIPDDKAAFKKDVLTWLAESSKSLPDVMAALKAGKVTVHTMDEVPEFNFKPDISISLLNNGMYGAGGGIYSYPGVDQPLYEGLEATRGQSVGALGNHQYEAYFLSDQP